MLLSELLQIAIGPPIGLYRPIPKYALAYPIANICQCLFCARTSLDSLIWVFQKNRGGPQNGWFIMVPTLLKWMIWGAHPYYWKHPNMMSIFASKLSRKDPTPNNFSASGGCPSKASAGQTMQKLQPRRRSPIP